jgi:hypothetical protein
MVFAARFLPIPLIPTSSMLHVRSDRFLFSFAKIVFFCPGGKDPSSSKTNSVYARRVNSLVLGSSLSQHRHPLNLFAYAYFVFSFRFIHS